MEIKSQGDGRLSGAEGNGGAAGRKWRCSRSFACKGLSVSGTLFFVSPPQISIPPSLRPSIIISKSTSAETNFTSPYPRITCIWAPPLPHRRTNSTRVDGGCNPPQSTALLAVGHTGLGLLRVD
ncbi:hypothetical protein NC652_006667 [Populus alba x Populus x berolinensis]|nr:hypothetical protein NC652_006667 [Populus alba x Populus x berolinensis]